MAFTAEDYYEKIMNNVLKPEDTFTFTCQMCGNCCRKRSDPIVITGPDVFRIAQALNMKIGEVLNKHTIGYLGANSNVPVFVLRERQDGSCSLLRKGKCMVQSNKPVVCAIFPLGRFTKSDTMEINYFTQDVSCPGVKNGSEITLKDWLDSFGIEKLDEMNKAWMSLLMGLTAAMVKKDKKKITQDMFNYMTLALYVGYDTSLPYEEQVEKNKEFVAAYMEKACHIRLEF